MVQTAISDEEDVAARNLPVENSRDVDAGLADQEASELQHDLRFAQALRQTLEQLAQLFADRGNVEVLVPREVRNAKAAADVEDAHWPRGMLGQARRELYRLRLCLADGFGAQVLGAAENVEAFEGEVEFPNAAEHRRYALRVHAELLRAAAHLHSGALQLKIRIDAYRDARAATAAQPSESLHLA